MSTKTTINRLSQLLPEGTVKRMAEAASVSQASVSKALKRARPGNRFVIEAMRIAESSGGLAVAQKLATLIPTA